MTLKKSLAGYVLAAWASSQAAISVSAAPHGHDDKTVTITSVQTVTAAAEAQCSTSVATTASASGATDTTVTTATTAPASSNTNPTTTLVATATATNYGLNDAAKAAGKLWFGTAADIPGTGEAEDPYYMAEFNNTHDFGGATPANIMKYEFTEPEQGVFNYTGGDAFLALAHATGKLVRCHNLIWYNELPTWLTSPATPWTNETLSAVLVHHVTSLVTHFGDRCYSWDVVNEALSDDPATGAWQPNLWYDTIGPAYVPLAFAAAARAAAASGLRVKLYYNDYNIEAPGGAKSAAARRLVAQLRDRGVRIDGVGLESHFVVGGAPGRADQEANMRAFAALGVDVAVTELDVRAGVPANASTQAQQVRDYYSTVAACVNVERCVGITVWDFDDTYSWIPGTFAGQGYGDLFLQPDGANTPLVKKAAYDGCLEALTGVPEGL